VQFRLELRIVLSIGAESGNIFEFMEGASGEAVGNGHPCVLKYLNLCVETAP